MSDQSNGFNVSFRRGMSVVVLVVLFSGCTTPAYRQGQALVERGVAQVGQMVTTSAPILKPLVRRSYLLQIGDLMDVKFFYSPELNESPVVRPDGRISLQLVGDIQAAGLTSSQLADAIRTAYKGILSNPEITIVVKQYSPQRIYVAGEVLRPGEVELRGDMTALHAVIQAGDFTQDAERRNVVIVRNNGTGVPELVLLDFAGTVVVGDGEAHRACGDKKVECDQITQVGKPERFALQPSDIVFVPQTRIASTAQFFHRYIDNIVPLFRNMGFGLSYNLTPEVQVKN